MSYSFFNFYLICKHRIINKDEIISINENKIKLRNSEGTFSHKVSPCVVLVQNLVDGHVTSIFVPNCVLIKESEVTALV